eukprot:NODE_1443_length_2476_cov_5.808855.p1 GENE.NODE_1443_length_2476_cov_5.808855~~NODE_1443_length_2476_cov_5.808855.p1  ORF type:complete len:781 (-),score=181.63 NODE_1443_length_2476_cov_5.808855:134-2335(-)
MSGQEVSLLLECGSQETLAESQDWEDLTVCFISVIVPDAPKPWTSYSRILPSADHSLVRYRTYRGLHVIAQVMGTFYHFDHYELYLWFVGCLVIMRMPSSIMQLITTRWLGHLSRMYLRAVKERFNLTCQIARAPVELMVNTAAFHEIADREDGITRAAFQTSMIEALHGQWQILDEDELGRVVEVCYNQMAREWKRNPSHESFRSRLLDTAYKKSVSTIRHAKTGMGATDSSEMSAISEDCFIHCGMLGSSLSFNDLVMIFDQDRPLGIIERLFIPSKLSKFTRSLSEDTKRSVKESMHSAEQKLAGRGALQRKNSDSSSSSIQSEQLRLKKATVGDLEIVKEECQTAINESTADLRNLISMMNEQVRDLQMRLCDLQLRLEEPAASLTEGGCQAPVASAAAPMQNLADCSTAAPVLEMPPSRARQGLGPIAAAVALCEAAALPSARAQAPAPPTVAAPSAPSVPETSTYEPATATTAAPQVLPVQPHSLRLDDVKHAQDVANEYHNLGIESHIRGDYAQAIQCHRKALQIRQTQLGDDNLDVAATHNNLGVAFQLQDDPQNALFHHALALEARRKALGENHEIIAESHHNIALVQQQMHDYGKSLGSHKAAAAVRSRALGISHQKTGDSHYNIATILTLMDKDAEAIKHFAKTLEILRACPENHKVIGTVLTEMAAACSKLGKYQLAFECYENALSILKTSYSDGHPKLMRIYSAMATSLQDLGRTQEAKE